MHTPPSLSGNTAGWMQLGEEGATEKCLLFLLCVGRRGQGASYIRSGGETHQVSLLKYPVSTKEDQPSKKIKPHKSEWSTIHSHAHVHCSCFLFAKGPCSDIDLLGRFRIFIGKAKRN